MSVTAVQAAARLDFGRFGGFPTVRSAIRASYCSTSYPVSVTAVQAAAGRFGGFLLFGLQYLPAAISAVILRLLQLSKLLSE